MAQNKYVAIPTMMGRNRILVVIAPIKSSWLANTKDVVRPQAGHGRPVISLKRQPMEKGVWIVRIKINTPIPNADKIITAWVLPVCLIL